MQSGGGTLSFDFSYLSNDSGGTAYDLFGVLIDGVLIGRGSLHRRDYALMIERAVRDLLALPVETHFIDNLSIAQRLERSTQDGARYCIIVGPAHERTGTTNLHNLRAESRAQRTRRPSLSALDFAHHIVSHQAHLPMSRTARP